MEMINIDSSRSSQIAQIGFTAPDLCYILFRKGGFYEHGKSSPEEFELFKNAEKPGEFFNRNIKGREPFRKLSEGFSEVAPVSNTEPIREPIVEVEVDEPAQSALVAPEEQNQEVERVAERSSLLVQNAKAIKVADETTQAQASEMLLAVASMLKQIETTFKPMKDAAFRSHKIICEQEKKVASPLMDAERALKFEIGEFVMAQRRIARQQEEEARRVEQERAEAESRAESERLAIEDAIALEAVGDVKGAEAVLAAPAPAPVRYVAPASVAPAIAHTSGVGVATVWDFRITDENLIPREYLLVNEKAIAAIGKTTKGKAKIAGVEFFEKGQVSASRGGR